MCEPNTDKWQAEYREAGECFRVYTTFLLTIVKGVTAGNAVLFAALAYLTRDGFKTNLQTLLVAFLGMLVSVGAIGIQKRTYKFWRLFLKRAAEIEKGNELELYTSTNAIAVARGIIPSSLVVLLVYGTLAFFWFVVLLKAVGITDISLDL